jgi:hypothetical protein
MTDVDATAITLAIAAARKQTIIAAPFASYLELGRETDPLYHLGMKEW